jgi:ABC-type branched-subunit amino acid transport system substrate-binding protein
LLSRGAATGAALAGGALLAACGSSSKSATTNTTTTSAGGATTTGAATTTGTATTGGSDLNTQLRDILGPLPTGQAAGQGLTIKMGCDFSLSGQGTAYGIGMYHGTLLGVAHVKAAGGPNFQLYARDSPAGDLNKGTANTREFGSLGCPVVLTSQGGGGGGGAPFYNEYKMWAVDAGAAVRYNNNKPFLYQGRAAFILGLLPTMVEYLQKKRPTVKNLSFVSYNLPGTLSQQELKANLDYLKAAGYNVAPPVLITIGTADWSTYWSQVAAQKPDLIISSLASNDLGLALKQYSTAGIGKKIVGVDWLPAYAPVAGPTGVKPYEFCFDYFNINDPGNQWAKLFVQSYESMFSNRPIYYSANYYEQAFVVWALVRRIIAKGGDPTKQGEAYVNAINEGGVFPSVYYGGTGKTGSLEFDLTTHALKHRPVAYGKALADGTGTVYAIADTTGAGFAFTPAGQAATSSTEANAA